MEGKETQNLLYGTVAQLDEHEPSKFTDAGSNPVSVKYIAG